MELLGFLVNLRNAGIVLYVDILSGKRSLFAPWKPMPKTCPALYKEMEKAELLHGDSFSFLPTWMKKILA